MKKYTFPVLCLTLFLCSCGSSSRISDLCGRMADFFSEIISGISADSRPGRKGNPVAGKKAVKAICPKSYCEIPHDDSDGEAPAGDITAAVSSGFSPSYDYASGKGKAPVNSRVIPKGRPSSAKHTAFSLAVRAAGFRAGSAVTETFLAGKKAAASASGADRSSVNKAAAEKSVPAGKETPQQKIGPVPAVPAVKTADIPKTAAPAESASAPEKAKKPAAPDAPSQPRTVSGG
ncbi:MAG: hypothetical protein ACRCUT_04640, partial [Spirochaetota bacterium]